MELIRAIRDGLALLEKHDFVLGIQDVSFPNDDGEDIGRGTPYSRGAERFLGFAARLGFTGIQLGPQGITHRGSASPYEGTLFSRNPLNLPLGRLVERELLSRETLQALVARRPAQALRRSPYAFVFDAYERIKDEVFAAYRARPSLQPAVAAYARDHEQWLLRDALYDVLCAEHARPYWREWPSDAGVDRRLFAPRPGEEERAQRRIESLRQNHARAIERHALLQLLLEEEHRALRVRTRELGLALFGDLQIGYSAQDAWAYQALCLEDYRMGAPPSRTNPDGQPWGYGVVDPAGYGTADAPGPVLEFVRARLERVFEEYDGVRIDHPHGWVCPWVYRADDPDPLHAVQNGARLFSSPGVPAGHERLSGFAIARPDQLRPELPPYADDWVATLEPAQVDRYALLIDAIVDAAAARGLSRSALACEVLSTLPYPVHRVLERHGLGRFRVTQKASLADPRDVYRSEHAQPGDWIMLGNHDTPPIWKVVEGWAERGELPRRAEYIASRLARETRARERLAPRLASDPRWLVQAMLADALASRAHHVYVFFADLFGLREVFNAPGTSSDSNWSLRAPHQFEAEHAERSARLEALNVPAALSLALRARGGEERLQLADALDASRPHVGQVALGER
ncbi:MAG TPA: 4-alpha-glucanotransferase [Myxococcaceae bacterium]|nr:4-alpha-glucanotransferase [Myxococcaceae bacterium]